MTAQERATEFFSDETEFRDWLESNHAVSEGVWLKFAKKGTGIVSLNHARALDVALCYGWIDGQAKSIDDTYYLQGFTPRRAQSPWSKRNQDKVAELIEQGLMQPAGQAEIDRAKADGRWDRASDTPSTAKPPQDFLDELAKNPAAEAFFATLTQRHHFAVHKQLNDAKKPETRVRRIAKFIEKLAEGKPIV
ncbi:YdeI/OmpD-associated family protein [Antrihabitans stalactiti]|uniref:Bacteriocin-protection protein, YdeI/OmpD-associated family n=1 Tax=Antrihabitans stalactiti TaxID=2584121 RepID=A0A848KIZ0_9NOCA|nr:YdeI/OmpD-associated family protein [Antrihabitans stalactiti]NMN96190.1 hypothetical protein [Antrihabitans stalactiti]